MVFYAEPTLILFCLLTVAAKQKHIVFILVDDLAEIIGYNDISWHNPDIISPNLEALAKTGIILESQYVQPICTPTRAAVMTGYYPIHTGRHVGILKAKNPNGLFTNFTLLPERLNELGYRSHMVGKWHLGFCNEDYLPNSRGFLSFHGFYNAEQNYYNRSLAGGYDFHLNGEVDWTRLGTYSTFVFAEDAKQLITDHALNHEADPFFLYLAFNAVHAPNQVPDEYLEMYPNIQYRKRKKLSGMVTALDDAIGTVVEALKNAGMYEDTLIVFTSDNGGTRVTAGSNYPLRGQKNTLWEGGTRVVSFLHAPFLNNSGTIYDGLIHVTDWLPTLYSAAGGDASALGSIDGIDQWDSIINSGPSKRTEMLYNINPEITLENSGSAYRIGEMKLICGYAGYTYDDWTEPERSFHDEDDSEHDYSELILKSTKAGTSITSACLFGDLPVRLFNLTADPTEHFDISRDHPNIVLDILERLQHYEGSMIPSFMDPMVDKGASANFGGVFMTGWCESAPAGK